MPALEQEVMLPATERLEIYLDENPGDWAARRVLADAYEDAGDAERASYYRWSVLYKKRPISDWEAHHWNGLSENNQGKWCWYSNTETSSLDPKYNHCLCACISWGLLYHPTIVAGRKPDTGKGELWDGDSRRKTEEKARVNLESVGYDTPKMPETKE